MIWPSCSRYCDSIFHYDCAPSLVLRHMQLSDIYFVSAEMYAVTASAHYICIAFVCALKCYRGIGTYASMYRYGIRRIAHFDFRL